MKTLGWPVQLLSADADSEAMIWIFTLRAADGSVTATITTSGNEEPDKNGSKATLNSFFLEHDGGRSLCQQAFDQFVRSVGVKSGGDFPKDAEMLARAHAALPPVEMEYKWWVDGVVMLANITLHNHTSRSIRGVPVYCVISGSVGNGEPQVLRKNLNVTLRPHSDTLLKNVNMGIPRQIRGADCHVDLEALSPH
jgi:hypothetical protein